MATASGAPPTKASLRPSPITCKPPRRPPGAPPAARRRQRWSSIRSPATVSPSRFPSCASSTRPISRLWRNSSTPPARRRLRAACPTGRSRVGAGLPARPNRRRSAVFGFGAPSGSITWRPKPPTLGGFQGPLSPRHFNFLALVGEPVDGAHALAERFEHRLSPTAGPVRRGVLIGLLVGLGEEVHGRFSGGDVLFHRDQEFHFAV